ncbi:hypothetical protein EDD18DRAFT_1346481 [Armillaria luteobubalina]|uniref:Ricin B lectin domain-containing protein n=1 Tax=Armillaria luteobubalina TaxID=153913 RepID=A0AA39UXH8_9AGAR|nr:hypothetical protein EDD18DRAFT_1346481 [Armillaria luteobubalina]
MSSSILFFISALFFTAATASPLAARGVTPGCHPNFEGAALTLTTPSGANSWSAKPTVGAPVISGTSPSKFFFQQNGNPVVSYTVKTAENNNFAVQLNGAGLSMANVDPSGSNANQKWMVDCSTCATGISGKKGVVASGCSITSNTNGLCVTNQPGAQLTLSSCNNSADQKFDFSV